MELCPLGVRSMRGRPRSLGEFYFYVIKGHGCLGWDLFSRKLLVTALVIAGDMFR